MTTFIALYRGITVAGAKLVAVSADPNLVADVSRRLLQKQLNSEADLVLQSLERGRREALRLIHKEAEGSGYASDR